MNPRLLFILFLNLGKSHDLHSQPQQKFLFKQHRIFNFQIYKDCQISRNRIIGKLLLLSYFKLSMKIIKAELRNKADNFMVTSQTPVPIIYSSVDRLPRKPGKITERNSTSPKRKGFIFFLADSFLITQQGTIINIWLFKKSH